MFNVVAEYNIPYVLMYTGTPKDMMLKTDYHNIIVDIQLI